MKKITIVLFLSIFFSVAANAGTDGENSLSKNKPESVKDCFETVNRGIFAFNQFLDGVIFEPVARGYRYIPSPIRTGTGNAVNNLSNLVTVPNNLLQGDVKQAGVNTARFVINSTVGILGIFDPASKLGLKERGKEDFGQTIGAWGADAGCYFVLPILGPTTARDSLGMLADSYVDPFAHITLREKELLGASGNTLDYYSVKGTNAINFRANNLNNFNSMLL